MELCLQIERRDFLLLFDFGHLFSHILVEAIVRDHLTSYLHPVPPQLLYLLQ
jgi:hypothetical protein